MSKGKLWGIILLILFVLATKDKKILREDKERRKPIEIKD